MTVHFSVDAQSAGKPFAHYWELCVGSCHAIMGTRQDWREQLEKVHRELGFQYVRFHGLLDDAMSVCKREADGRLRFCFYNIDSIFDFLLKIGMKPFIELGFMPEALASGTATCFHYKANVSPPADYAEWGQLIEALTRHLVARYGLAEVRSWFFEVWNEPNLRFFFAGTQEEYFKLYESAARAIKGVDAQLRVGGPATSVNAWLPDMLRFVQASGAPLDFLSTHHYPTDDPLWKHSDLTIEEFFKNFAETFGKYERGVLYKMTAKARSEAGKLPLYYTEWNTSAVVPDALHDEPFAAAFVAKTIADNDGLVQAYSFWTFSDLFEENGQLPGPFHGGFGMQSIYGIPKPTYRVFEMLHGLGDRRLAVEGGGSSVELLAVQGEGGLTLLAYNTDVPAAEIQGEEVEIELKGLTPASARITRIDAENANPKRRWEELGSPMYPTPAELEQIAAASVPQSGALIPAGNVLSFALPPHAVACISIK